MSSLFRGLVLRLSSWLLVSLFGVPGQASRTRASIGLAVMSDPVASCCAALSLCSIGLLLLGLRLEWLLL